MRVKEFLLQIQVEAVFKLFMKLWQKKRAKMTKNDHFSNAEEDNVLKRS